MSQEVEAILRGFAIMAGFDDIDNALKDFRRGKALARLVSATFSCPETKSPGPDKNKDENWNRFVAYVVAKRIRHADKARGIRSSKDSTLELAVIIYAKSDVIYNIINLEENIRQTYFRMKRECGWKDEDVLPGIGALFFPPPPE